MALLSKYAAYFVKVTPNTSRSLPAEKLTELARGSMACSATVCGGVWRRRKRSLGAGEQAGHASFSIGKPLFFGRRAQGFVLKTAEDFAGNSEYTAYPGVFRTANLPDRRENSFPDFTIRFSGCFCPHSYLCVFFWT